VTIAFGEDFSELNRFRMAEKGQRSVLSSFFSNVIYVYRFFVKKKRDSLPAFRALFEINTFLNLEVRSNNSIGRQPRLSRFKSVEEDETYDTFLLK
jgi:hypothetical protein